MEFQYTMISFILSIIITLLFIIRFRSLNSVDANKNLPPQPWKLPLIGHLHHLSGSQPHRILAKLAEKLGPVIHLQLGEVSTIIISSSPAAKQIMKTHDLNFATRPKLLSAEILAYNYTDIVFSPYGDYWRQMRKICVMELLSAKRVNSFRSVREQESWNLIESIRLHESQNKTIDLTDKIAMTVNTIICRIALGSGFKEQARLVRLIDEIMPLSGGFDLAHMFPSIKLMHMVTGMRKKLIKCHKIYDSILDNVISDHQQGQLDENEDLLDVLLRLKDDGSLPFPLSYDNIKAVIADVFTAGTDTSSSTIEWAITELMQNPRVMKKVQAELRETLKGKKKIYESDIQQVDYLDRVIKETLRLHPPAPFLIPRESRESCEIGGYHIPANTKVLVNVWKIAHDPDYWTDPDSFIPERYKDDDVNYSKMETDFIYLPFGAGRRMCPAMTLGLTNLKLPLAMLLYHFDWDLPDGANLDVSEIFGATLRKKYHLLVVPRPYIIS